MEIQNPDTMVSAQLQAIFNYLVSYDTLPSVIYLSGVHGSGKTFLAQKLHDHFDSRVVTLGWSEKNRYRAQWVVLADNGLQNNCLHRSYALNSLLPTLINNLGLTCGQPLTIVIENAHWCGQDIANYVALFQQYHHAARVILLGESERRQRKPFRYLQAEFITLEKPTWQEARDFLIQKSNITSASDVFTPSFTRRVLNLSRGDINQLTYAATATALLLQAEQTQTLSRRQQRLIYHSLGDKRGYRLRLGGLCCGALLAIAMGWMIAPSLSKTLTLPDAFLPTPPVIKESEITDIAHVAVSDRNALSLLFTTWGYDVSPEEAWCNQAQRAQLRCKSGKASLNALETQGIPWIATINVGQKKIPVVVVRVSTDSLDVLISQQTWTVKREWFETAWKGDYLLLWKPSPLGETSITRDSDEEDILWLENTLNNALNLTSSPTGEWNSVLAEKVKLFQQKNQLVADGVVGPSTLMRLWQVAGESARLFNDDDKQ